MKNYQFFDNNIGKNPFRSEKGSANIQLLTTVFLEATIFRVYIIDCIKPT